MRVVFALTLAVLLSACATAGMSSPGIRSLHEPPRPWTVSTQAVADHLRANLNCAAIDPRQFTQYGLESGRLSYSRNNRQGRAQHALIRDYDFVVHLPRTASRNEQYVFVRVPRGFVTDMYSIPEHLRPFVNRASNYAEASVVHDWLYAVGQPGDKPGRRWADDILYHAMLQLDAPKGLAERVYIGVDQGGAGGYGNEHELRFYDADPNIRVSYLPASPAMRDRLRAASTCVYPAAPALAMTGAHAG
jgi:hypothetical protein